MGCAVSDSLHYCVACGTAHDLTDAGKCFNVDQPTLDQAGGKAKALKLEGDGFYYCKDVLVQNFPKPGNYCPGLGIPQQCSLLSGGTNRGNHSVCDRYGHGGGGGGGGSGGGGGDRNDKLPHCTRFPGATELASASCFRGTVGDEWEEGGDCWWTDTPCEFSPYYPP
jgi:hypothetical protein